MQPNCPIIGPRCDRCSCSGSACAYLFPGMKVEWPELRGMSATEAKKKIESDNPYVFAFIYPQGVYLPAISCCNRVVLYVPSDDCPNGPVINLPIVG